MPTKDKYLTDRLLFLSHRMHKECELFTSAIGACIYVMRIIRGGTSHCSWPEVFPHTVEWGKCGVARGCQHVNSHELIDFSFICLWIQWAKLPSAKPGHLSAILVYESYRVSNAVIVKGGQMALILAMQALMISYFSAIFHVNYKLCEF